MNANVDKYAKLGDVSHHALQFHAFDEVVDGVHVIIERGSFNVGARVTSGFLKFLKNVGERGSAQLRGDVSLDVDAGAFAAVAEKLNQQEKKNLNHL